MQARSVAATFAAAILLAGCSSLGDMFSKDKDEGIDKRDAPTIYAEAREALEGSQYDRAVKLLEKLEAKFPYGRYAQQAQLDIAYAHYKAAEPGLAIAAVERFIKLHPNHANVDYAYYLKGLINFPDSQGVFGVIGQQDMTERDPRARLDAFDAFKELVTRFPNSRYAEDARLRMGYLVNALAAYELHVARYYQKRGAHLAAVNRAQATLRNYPRSPATEEALALMAASYRELGMPELANDSERVLKQNYPQSRFLAQGATPQRPWWKLW